MTLWNLFLYELKNYYYYYDDDDDDDDDDDEEPWLLLKDPKYELTVPFSTMPQLTLWKEQTLSQSRDPPHLKESTRLCKQKKQPEQWRASATNKNISLHKDELSLYPIH